MKTLVIFSILLLTLSVRAETPYWRYAGPDGGTAAFLVSDPNHPGLLLVDTSDGVYRSNDGGTSWVRIFDPMLVDDIVIHPRTSRIYVLARQGLYVSDDQARSFRQTAPTHGSVYNLFTVDSDQDLLYGTDGSLESSLYWSSDLGRHWTGIALPTPENAYWNISGFAVAPFSVGTLYISGERCIDTYDESVCSSFLLNSTNSGRSWHIVDRSLCELFADPPDRILATCSGHFSVITAHGQERKSKIHFDLIRSVPGHRNEVYGLQFYVPKGTPPIYYSTNLGQTWISITGPGDYVESLVPLASSPRTILAGTFFLGVVRKQGFEPWTQSSQGIQGNYLHEVSAPQGRVYATAVDHLWRRSPEDKQWSYVRQKDISHIAVDPANPLKLFETSYQKSTVSTDGGKTWKGAGPYDSVTFSPSNSAIIYFTSNSNFFKSTDGGTTVQRLPLLVSAEQIQVDASDPNTLYFLEYYRGMLKSSDGGRTMSAINTGLNPLTVRSFAQLGPRNSLLAIEYTNDVFRTDNGGASWRHLSKIPGNSGSSDRYLNPLPIYPVDWNGEHFFVVSGNRLMETTNGGKTWADVSPVGSTRLSVNGISDPRQHPIYVATDHGLYVH